MKNFQNHSHKHTATGYHPNNPQSRHFEKIADLLSGFFEVAILITTPMNLTNL